MMAAPFATIARLKHVAQVVGACSKKPYMPAFGFAKESETHTQHGFAEMTSSCLTCMFLRRTSTLCT
jgi:hypothetical protein